VLCWVKYGTDTDNAANVAESRDTGGLLNGWKLFVRPTTDDFAFLVDTSNGFGAPIGTSNPEDDVWHLLGGRWDGTTVGVIFDGSEEATASRDGTISKDVVTKLGIGTQNTTRLTGELFQFLFYTSNLTLNQIGAIFRGVNPFPIDPTNRSAFLPLWGNQDPEPDYSPNANTGSVTGAARFTPNPPVELLENYL